jgi:hypothetical protein
MTMRLTPEAVRHAMLWAQGLHTPPDSPPEARRDLLSCIRRMGYLQIDTIQVVARSPYLVLWSRLGDYPREWLHELHAGGDLFEHYAHALCFIPIDFYPYYRRMMLDDRRVWSGWRRWAENHPEVLARVRQRVQDCGPVCSSDFKTERMNTGWGGAKEEKIALDYLFASGAFMIPYRKKFQRYYDLTERVLPEWDDADAPDFETARRELVREVVRALGAAREDWVAPYLSFSRTEIPPVLEALAQEGGLVAAEVPQWEQPVYIHPDQVEPVRQAAAGEKMPDHTTLLSPFDPLISDRDRTRDLFDFDFKLEAYTPVKDRQFGYFCLPILHQGRLVGRLDPKAHRKEKRMEIKHLYLEPGFVPDDAFMAALRRTLMDFTAWHGMQDLEILGCDSPELAAALQ